MRVQRILSAFALTLLGMLEVRAAEMGAGDYSCGNGDTDIVTDRPDVTNSSRVVPHESAQVENGINWTTRQDATVIDGSNTRVRIGFAQCMEVLFDLPNYFHPLHGSAATGFSDFSPAIKRQLGPLPGDIELSVTVGFELPTGSARIAGQVYGGYVQLPWSKEIADGWSLSGMFTGFLMPGGNANNPTSEPDIRRGAATWVSGRFLRGIRRRSSAPGSFQSDLRLRGRLSKYTHTTDRLSRGIRLESRRAGSCFRCRLFVPLRQRDLKTRDARASPRDPRGPNLFDHDSQCPRKADVAS